MNIYLQNKTFTFAHSMDETPSLNTFHAHIHNEYEILYIISGDCSHVIEDKVYKLKKNDLIIVRPGKYHFIQIDSSIPYERYNLLLNPQFVPPKILESLCEAELLSCMHNNLINDIFSRLDYFYSALNEQAFEDIFSALVKELLYCISLHKSPANQTYTDNPVLSQILNYIEQNLCRIDSVRDVAEANYLSEAYIFKIFKMHLKTSPHKYICGKRLTLAQKLIRRGVRPTTAAEQCGFYNYTTFYKSYIKYFGNAPSQDYLRLTD